MRILQSTGVDIRLCERVVRGGTIQIHSIQHQFSVNYIGRDRVSQISASIIRIALVEQLRCDCFRRPLIHGQQVIRTDCRSNVCFPHFDSAYGRKTNKSAFVCHLKFEPTLSGSCSRVDIAILEITNQRFQISEVYKSCSGIRDHESSPVEHYANRGSTCGRDGNIASLAKIKFFTSYFNYLIIAIEEPAQINSQRFESSVAEVKKINVRIGDINRRRAGRVFSREACSSHTTAIVIIEIQFRSPFDNPQIDEAIKREVTCSILTRFGNPNY